MQYDASHDALTNLANRREFEQRLAQLLVSSRTKETEHALLYLDLDQFKIINDTCGHDAGDELLRQLSAKLAEQIRSRDMIARLGGDEFGILLEHCSLEQAQQLGEALRQTVEAYAFVWEKQVFRVGVSIGLVAITPDISDAADVLKAADAACYAAKDAGRNCLQVFQPENIELTQRYRNLQWMPRLRQAMKENRFRLYSQRILSLDEASADAVHYEILVRLLNEQGELVLPRQFLAAAERYGMAINLDRWVVGTVTDWLSKQATHLERLRFCNINLSSHSIGNEAFLGFVLDCVQKYPAIGQKLCFEITETTAIADFARAAKFINTLRQRGCHFALDNFGSGVASFAHLKNLPVDFLKIDGALVRGIVENSVDLEIVSCINTMAQATGKQTIAEFAENDAIVRILRDIGVNYAQGYAIERPRPLQEDGRV
jgi:diguanylate cyclase (GGDEF)-like protein